MSENTAVEKQNTKNTKTKSRLKELKLFLKSMNVGVRPTVHVNGKDTYFAILTVDFGSPVTPIRISNDQYSTLNEHMVSATKEIIGDNRKVSVLADNNNGVFWTAIQ